MAAYILLFFALVLGSMSYANPGFMTYQGRLYNSLEEPINSGIAEVKFKLMSPDGECLLREEVHNLNMDNSAGFFSISLGNGAPSTNSPNYTLSQALSNAHTFSDALLGCTGNTYAPGDNDTRVLRVTVNGEDLTPDQIISSVPYSRIAATLQGESLTDIEASYRSYADTNLAGSTLPDLQATPLNAGESFRWSGTQWEVFSPGNANLPANSVTLDDVSFASTSGVNIPQLAANPASPVAGQIYYNTTTNKMMVYNGTGWVETGASASPWATAGVDISYLAGNVGVGTATPDASLEVVTSSSSFPRGILSTKYGDDTGASRIETRKARGTVGSPTAIQSGDNIGNLSFSGHDGTDFGGGADIVGIAAENFTAFAKGTSLRIQTTPTGGTTKTTRLLIEADGNVGIGTLSPEGILHTVGTQYQDRTENTSFSAAHLFRKSREGGIVQSEDELGYVAFEGHDGSGFLRGAHILAKVDGTPGANDMPTRLSFHTTADGAASANERMRITNSGNVGIGTATPATTLDVQGTIRSKNNSYPIFRADGYGSPAAGHFIGSMARGTEASPTYPLLNDHLATFQGRDAIDWAHISSVTMLASEDFSASSKGTHISFQNTANGTTTPVERMRITHDGNVGIGITNPQSKLQVVGYTQLDTIAGAPPGADCDASSEYGRMKVDPTAEKMWVCMASGWIDTVTGNGTCGGASVGGACWYLGGDGQSCTTVCSTRGGYNAATETYAGSGGTDNNCQTVLNALSAAGSSVTPFALSVGVGCNYFGGAGAGRIRDTSTTTAGATLASGFRACACNE